MPPRVPPLGDGLIALRPYEPTDREAIIGGHDAAARRWLGGDPGQLTPAACIRAGAAVVGWIDYDEHCEWLSGGEANVAYSVFPEHRGKSYGTRALRLLSEFLTTQAPPIQPTLLIDPANHPSVALAIRAGFEQVDEVNGQCLFKLAAERSEPPPPGGRDTGQVGSRRAWRSDFRFGAAGGDQPGDEGRREGRVDRHLQRALGRGEACQFVLGEQAEGNAAVRVRPGPWWALALLAAGCGSAAAPSSADLDRRAEQLGVAPELIYVTDVTGYQRTVGGTGVYGDDAFQDIYVSGTGEIRLTVEARSLSADGCPNLPIPAAEPAQSPVRCANDGSGWERASGDRQEYARQDGDRLVRVSGRTDATSMDLLRTAARKARPASARQLDDLLPPPSSDSDPPARGDLPRTGDGAPNNSVGPGG